MTTESNYRTNKFNEEERKCPECGEWAHADFVDNGVELQQCGPYVCKKCGWCQTNELKDLLLALKDYV